MGHEEGNQPQLPVKASDANAEPQTKRTFEKLLCGGGILFFFLFYGIIQERIMTKPYGEEEVMFTYSAYLVLSNRVVAICVAVGMLFYTQQPINPAAPWYKFFAISISNTVATYCQYEALKYVSFPTQTLGKCAKTIPVLILGTLIGGKKYGVSNYIECIVITAGCVLFVLTGDIVAPGDKDDSIYGLMFMAGYLFFDGFTSVFQEKLFRGYKMSTYNQMLYVNIFSALISILMLSSSGTLFPAVQFSLDYPLFFISSIGLSLCATGGQLVIYYTIKHFGALFFAIVMTTRQVFSILLSCLIYFHPLTLGQWFGAATVFGALYYKGATKKPSSHK